MLSKAFYLKNYCIFYHSLSKNPLKSRSNAMNHLAVFGWLSLLAGADLL